MTESPTGIFAAMIVAAIVGRWWWRDFSAARTGALPSSGVLPGATACGRGFVACGALGAVLLTVLETAGELVLGISDEQKNISVFFLGAMLAAAFIEELVFRGFFVIANKTRTVLIASIISASLAFALAHDFLWQYHLPEGVPWWAFWRGFSTQFTLKGWFSFSFVFIASIYFYILRFHPRNTLRSLLPCFAAHAAKNLAVFIIKVAQGHVG
jgi:membrane protease YdiL (CAAX protease family)